MIWRKLILIQYFDFWKVIYVLEQLTLPIPDLFLANPIILCKKENQPKWLKHKKTFWFSPNKQDTKISQVSNAVAMKDNREKKTLDDWGKLI